MRLVRMSAIGLAALLAVSAGFAFAATADCRREVSRIFYGGSWHFQPETGCLTDMCDGGPEDGCEDYFIIGDYWHNCQCVNPNEGLTCQIRVHVPGGSGTTPDAVNCKPIYCPKNCTPTWSGSPTNQAFSCPCQ
jgi:hypothetical protein